MTMASCMGVKSVQNLQELGRCCFVNTQSLRPKKGFVNYGWRNHRAHQLCKAPQISAAAAAVVNNTSTEKDSDSSVYNLNYSASKINTSTSSIICPIIKKKRMVDEEEEVDDVSGKLLDQWVKESVAEILNNLDEAPFLVHIYSDAEEASASTCKTRLITEKADAESWPLIKGSWGGESPTPSGIILVVEMSSEDAVGPDGEILQSAAMDYDSCSASTKVWGILIQGRTLSFPACYILKTCRVRSVSGFCTHFGLVRVKNFFETVDIQLKKLWLV